MQELGAFPSWITASMILILLFLILAVIKGEMMMTAEGKLSPTPGEHQRLIRKSHQMQTIVMIAPIISFSKWHRDASSEESLKLLTTITSQRTEEHKTWRKRQHHYHEPNKYFLLGASPSTTPFQNTWICPMAWNKSLLVAWNMDTFSLHLQYNRVLLLCRLYCTPYVARLGRTNTVSASFHTVLS